MAVFSVAVSSRHPLILFVTRGVLIPLPARLLPMVARTNKGFNGSIKITGANAGGLRELPTRTRWAARVAQFHRSAASASRFDALRLGVFAPLRFTGVYF